MKKLNQFQQIVLERAEKFVIYMHRGRYMPPIRLEATSLATAKEIAEAIVTADTKPALVYAVWEWRECLLGSHAPKLGWKETPVFHIRSRSSTE